MVVTDLNNTNKHGSNSVLKLYPNPEKMPDKPYFTKEIFLNLCLNDMKRLAVVRGLLTDQLLEKETKGVVCTTLDTIIENQKAILQGVASGQITFLNKADKGEMNESNRK
ncbi:hypothetical protein QM860_02620 [Streptococcus parasanguinis]|uniref:hypothetical protein n=1 Tax=Streptococcus parasanguinis TaxID=1318 RepID=UPI0025D21BF0|nr:hypothetical protein [uncultured Streptococcus sp.]